MVVSGHLVALTFISPPKDSTVSKLSAQSAFRYPLSSVFSGQVGVRVSRVMFLHGGPLTIRELATRTGATRKSVYASIGSLVDLGVVHRIGSAQAGLFQIVADHPLSACLAGLFRAEDARVQQAYRAIREAAEEALPKPMAAWLYGSAARGEDTASSDLDLAVCADENDVEAAVEAMREALRPVGEHLSIRFSLVGLSPLDIVRMARDGDPFWKGLAQDARAMYGPDPDEVLRIHRRGAHLTT